MRVRNGLDSINARPYCICAPPGCSIASYHGISGLLTGARPGAHICQTEWCPYVWPNAPMKRSQYSGRHSVWQMWAPGRAPVNNPLMPWYEAIDQPGAAQMQHARALLESRPFLSRIPDDDVVVPGAIRTSMPGTGRYHFAATRDANGSYAMVYAPVGRPFTVRMNKISGAQVTAWWFNPRTGSATRIGTFPNTPDRTFTPPDPGEAVDWVLVLDDASKQYPTPGAARP